MTIGQRSPVHGHGAKPSGDTNTLPGARFVTIIFHIAFAGNTLYPYERVWSYFLTTHRAMEKEYFQLARTAADKVACELQRNRYKARFKVAHRRIKLRTAL